ncbi:spore coat protein CotJB [Brevibacillus nitrificans]|uniref:Spore coat protein CotJB n=1 Tax=Brevibacillus nitrificans TaxID=651560 RepID=A0A3M8DM32_9BACL|nr:spore coat protein CotJB [Brevibacillus nitrificans]RNB89162.1 spore coat protein CotJB [Brevibacillus nitrificans]
MNANPHTRPGDEQYMEMLTQLQAVDFVLCELNLYLDTHPNDANAIEQYNELVQQRWHMANEFETLYGPLMNLGHSYSGYPWQWNDTPWPWQV